MLNRIAIALIVMTAFALPCAAQPRPSSSKVTTYTLDNGLDVILRPLSHANLTTVMTLYDVGELHEPAGLSGIAHLTEHVLVTAATSEDDAMTVNQWFGQYNMQANAQTGLDYTLIAASVPHEQFAQELDRAAARLTGLTITEDDLAREKPRVLRELKHMYEGPPPLAARNIARQRIDPNPEGARRGGMPSVIEALTVEQMRDWHSSYYRCNNATLIVVGEFDLDSARQYIDERFGSLSSGDDLPPAREPAPIKPGRGGEVTADPIQAGEAPKRVVTLAFAAPEPGTDEWAAFLLIVPRIYQQVLMSGVQQSTTARPVIYTPLDDPGGLYITRPLEAGEDAGKALTSLWQCIGAACTFDLTAQVDRNPFQYEYGPMLHVVRVPDQTMGQHTYGEALRLGRFHQLGLTSDELRRQILLTEAASLNETAAKLFAQDRSFSVVVTAELKD